MRCRLRSQDVQSKAGGLYVGCFLVIGQIAPLLVQRLSSRAGKGSNGQPPLLRGSLLLGGDHLQEKSE